MNRLKSWFYTAFSDKTVVISEGLKSVFMKLGTAEKHLHVIHNGIPVQRYEAWSREKIAEFKERLQITDGHTVIGCIARRKKQEQLVAALPHLDTGRLKVVFAGLSDEEFQGFLSLAKELGVDDLLCNAGIVPGEEVLNLYRLCHVNVLPSTTDGFGLVLLEAMAMECPVVATAAGGITDVVKDGDNGLLFRDKDSNGLAQQIRRTLEDKQLRDKLIVAGKKTAFETFTIEKTTLNYETFFEALIATGK